jgi:hypothetical protein
MLQAQDSALFYTKGGARSRSSASSAPPARQAPRLRMGAYWTCTGSVPLAPLPLGATAHHPHRPLQPQTPPGFLNTRG